MYTLVTISLFEQGGSWITRIEPVGNLQGGLGGLPPPWILTLDGVPTKFLFETSLGTWMEHVLAYCRIGKKYVGFIEVLFCLTVTLTFGIRTWKFIGLMDEVLPFYQPSFTEISCKIREKIEYKSFSKISPGDLNLQSTSPNSYHVIPLSRAIHQPNMRKMGITINDREIADYAFLYNATLWPWPLTFTPENVHIRSSTDYLYTGQIWERSDLKWQINHMTQLLRKKKKLKKEERKDNTTAERSSDFVGRP